VKSAKLKDVELEYDVHGNGEPLLLVGPGPLADSLLPLTETLPLSARYRLIRYHQRGQCGSTPSTEPVSFQQHAADAAALLRHLGIARAHVAGHSTGGDIALQLALDFPDLVQTLMLLEPALLDVPSGAAFLERAAPAIEAYSEGDGRAAMAAFLSMACSLEWDACQAIIEQRIPGGVEQAIEDADSFFGSYLPSLAAWHFGAAEAARITQPVLSVLGTETDALFKDGRVLLHSWFAQIEDCTIEGAAHLLHMQQPERVARGMVEFLAAQEETPGQRMNSRTILNNPVNTSEVEPANSASPTEASGRHNVSARAAL
jgi:pimeloyl-ACP methyl ester carboxylesterase